MPLAFWEEVGIGVVSGLAVLAIGGVATWAIRQRGKRRRENAQRREERYIERAGLRAGLSAVGSELRDNGHIAERCETGQGHVPELVARVSVQAWADRRGEMMALRDEDRETWDELEETYRHLRQSKQSGGYPPKSDYLLALADRLGEKLDAEG
jgi:hypothetical protein